MTGEILIKCLKPKRQYANGNNGKANSNNESDSNNNNEPKIYDKLFKKCKKKIFRRVKNKIISKIKLFKIKRKLKEKNKKKQKIKKNPKKKILKKTKNSKIEIKNENPNINLLLKFKIINENFYDIEEIGSGSESNVFRAKLKSNDKEFAIKMIKLKEGEKKNYREYYILNKLKNLNIIEFYSINENKENNIDIIIMGLGKHGNMRDFLKNLIKKEYMSESLLCFFVSRILKALKFCHMNHVAHLDIKPQNIVIDEYLNIKIIDFSISLDYSKITSNKIKLAVCGTNFYIAPEILNMEEIDLKDINKVDLYSLGVLIYSLAFEYYPYNLVGEDSKDFNKIQEKINSNNLEFDNDDGYYSADFIDFLKKLLEKDINKRININEALEHHWIQGGNILYEEKEKLFNASQFLAQLICDHVKNFNDFVQKK